MHPKLFEKDKGIEGGLRTGLTQSSKAPLFAFQSCVPCACQEPRIVGQTLRFDLLMFVTIIPLITDFNNVASIQKLLHSNIKLTRRDETHLLFKVALNKLNQSLTLDKHGPNPYLGAT